MSPERPEAEASPRSSSAGVGDDELAACLDVFRRIDDNRRRIQDESGAA